MRAFLALILGVTAFVMSFVLPIVMDDHVFAGSGGAWFYGFDIIGLFAGGLLTINIAWGILADKANR